MNVLIRSSTIVIRTRPALIYLKGFPVRAKTALMATEYSVQVFINLKIVPIYVIGILTLDLK